MEHPFEGRIDPHVTPLDIFHEGDTGQVLHELCKLDFALAPRLLRLLALGRLAPQQGVGLRQLGRALLNAPVQLFIRGPQRRFRPLALDAERDLISH